MYSRCLDSHLFQILRTLLFLGGLALAICWGRGPACLFAEEHAAASGSLLTADERAARFEQRILPFVQSYCLDCHGSQDPEGMLDLTQQRSADELVQKFAIWELAANRVASMEMPPEDSVAPPDQQARTAFVEAIEELKQDYARRHAGDPGEVLAHRLSASEYNYTIRDLTGVDIRPASEFPVDPANEAGFDNSGESLHMTPALLRKYLSAARIVAEHLLLTPDGLRFAPHPVVTDTDRDKYCVRRVVEFYQRQNTDLSQYFFAAWQLHARSPVQEHEVAGTAADESLSAKYLTRVYRLLTSTDNHAGPVKQLRAMFKALPEEPAQAQVGCQEMQHYVDEVRGALAFDFPHLRVEGINRGSQPLVLWRNRQMASHRMQLNEDALVQEQSEPMVDQKAANHADNSESDGLDTDNINSDSSNSDNTNPDSSQTNESDIEDSDIEDAGQHAQVSAPDRWAEVRTDEAGVAGSREGDEKVNLRDSSETGEVALAEDQKESETQADIMPELVLPREPTQRARKLAALRVFCQVFPDRFYVDRRGRAYVDSDKKREEEEEVRLLSAGFHSMMGYFRDDQPLCELVLSDKQRQELDRLWFELDFIAKARHRQHAGFIWFERAEGRFLVDKEFDAYRSEDQGVTRQEMIQGLRDAYLAKAERLGAEEVALDAIREHFQRMNGNIRAVEEAWDTARSKHLDALVQFAERAFRRPLTAAEESETIAFYHQLVEQDGLSHEDAIRDAVVSILMSPHFCYRSYREPAREQIQPLSDFALASRLSYFLWSSMPDERLMEIARQGQLRDPRVLREQASRMLRDARARGLAVEFAGNWLGFRQFESHNSVDRSRFTQFDDPLRQAMFEEPVRFSLDIFQNNRPILDFLFAEHTYVNAVLAKHYEIEKQYAMEVGNESGGSSHEDRWIRIEQAAEVGRGGVLPMAVFLTKNSPGLRTSPVKRGFWVVRQLLGEHIPAPPPDVPDLPNDESQLGDLTLREVLARHREHESCAGCHEKFDSFGLVFESYGPIGERRETDLAGNLVDTAAELPDGSRATGVLGLQAYLQNQRQDDFVRTLCRKLLSFALGRSLLLTDEPLLKEMHSELQRNAYRFHSLVHTIVTSPQFMMSRGSAQPGPLPAMLGD